MILCFKTLPNPFAWPARSLLTSPSHPCPECSSLADLLVLQIRKVRSPQGLHTCCSSAWKTVPSTQELAGSWMRGQQGLHQGGVLAGKLTCIYSLIHLCIFSLRLTKLVPAPGNWHILFLLLETLSPDPFMASPLHGIAFNYKISFSEPHSGQLSHCLWRALPRFTTP